jgi:hypothetical protein
MVARVIAKNARDAAIVVIDAAIQFSTDFNGFALELGESALEKASYSR